MSTGTTNGLRVSPSADPEHIGMSPTKQVTVASHKSETKCCLRDPLRAAGRTVGRQHSHGLLGNTTGRRCVGPHSQPRVYLSPRECGRVVDFSRNASMTYDGVLAVRTDARWDEVHRIAGES